MTRPQKPSYERFLMPWGDTHYEKVAMRVPYDERFNDVMGELEWNDAHAKYDPDYEMYDAHPQADPGAWTMDADDEVLAYIRERSPITPPPLDDIQRVVDARPIMTGQLDLECQLCGSKTVLSDIEIPMVFPQPTREMEYCIESDASHYCHACHMYFDWQQDDREHLADATATPAPGDPGADVDDAASYM